MSTSIALMSLKSRLTLYKRTYVNKTMVEWQHLMGPYLHLHETFGHLQMTLTHWLKLNDWRLRSVGGLREVTSRHSTEMVSSVKTFLLVKKLPKKVTRSNEHRIIFNTVSAILGQTSTDDIGVNFSDKLR